MGLEYPHTKYMYLSFLYKQEYRGIFIKDVINKLGGGCQKMILLNKVMTKGEGVKIAKNDDVFYGLNIGRYLPDFKSNR